MAHSHCTCPLATWYFNCNRRRICRCTIYLHPFLMRTVYRNILVLIAGFCVLHLIFGGKIFLAIALIVLALSAVSEKAAILIEKGWMWIGGTLGTINAAILLFIIYYFLLTPIAFLSRIGAKDPMQLKEPANSNFRFEHHKYVADDLKNPW